MIRRNPWEDHYARKAREENWLARSVYKIEEINRKYKVIRRGDRVLDLGCYPGSWSQYCLREVGPRGDVVGIDLKAPERLSAPNFRCIQSDIFTLDLERLAREIGPRDAVISDMAPQTGGIRAADTGRSMELAGRAFDTALAVLSKEGHLLCKVFEGEDLKTFRDEISKEFELTTLVRPSAVRKGSREIYLLGLRFLRGQARSA